MNNFHAVVVNKNLGWGVLLLSTAAFTVLSIMLGYHWRQYVGANPIARRMQIVYFAVGIGLLLCELLALIYLWP